jgi:large subunit ribosomal protein L4
MRIGTLGSSDGIEASDALFARPYNEGLVHQLVTCYRSNGRQGTRAQKTRSEVKHSTRKLFRQKGTGRARGGMSSSPVRVAGGRAFPSRTDENFRRKINRKMYRGAMAVLLSALVAEGRLVVSAAIAPESPKTTEFGKWMVSQGLVKRTIFVDVAVAPNLVMAVRNLPNAGALPLGRLGPTDLLYYDRVVLSEPALRRMEEMWA